jgi:perosamine synthetase
VEVCEQFGLVLIEDAAESLGSFYKERHTGNWGKMATLSFNGNKIVTTGGGGALLVNDEEIGRQAKHLTTTAKVAHRWEYFHDRVGYNYRLPNLNAAVGCAQMEQLPDFVQRKRDLAARYEEEFRSVEGVRFFKEPTFARSNYWLNVLLLDEEHADQRDELLGRTNDLQVSTRPAWTLMHKLPMFDNCPRMELSVSENIQRRLVNIPSSSNLWNGDGA